METAQRSAWEKRRSDQCREMTARIVSSLVEVLKLNDAQRDPVGKLVHAALEKDESFRAYADSPESENRPLRPTWRMLKTIQDKALQGVLSPSQLETWHSLANDRDGNRSVVIQNAGNRPNRNQTLSEESP